MDDIPLGKTDKDQNKYDLLVKFKSKVSSGRLVKFWTSPAELASQAILALTKAFVSNPQVGWIRADKVPSRSTIADVLTYREKADRLQARVDEFEKSNRPQFADVAGLEQSTVIGYTYLHRSHGDSRGKQTMTYADVLRIVAPALLSPSGKSASVTAMGTGLIERFGAPDLLLKAKESDVQDALLHLIATGHVKMWTEKMDNDVHTTRYQLTEMGNKTWHEISYTKREPK